VHGAGAARGSWPQAAVAEERDAAAAALGARARERAAQAAGRKREGETAHGEELRRRQRALQQRLAAGSRLAREQRQRQRAGGGLKAGGGAQVRLAIGAPCTRCLRHGDPMHVHCGWLPCLDTHPTPDRAERRFRWGSQAWRHRSERMQEEELRRRAAAAVSLIFACIGSPCLRQCAHGASIGGGGAAGRRSRGGPGAAAREERWGEGHERGGAAAQRAGTVGEQSCGRAQRTATGVHPLALDADSQAPRALHLLSTRAHTRRWVKKALGEKGVG
jgi:hypothetical protein